tara:strand:- start:1206 stop:2126 length:921 start_codon:yes stop_codon:yes gene_type:complete
MRIFLVIFFLIFILFPNLLFSKTLRIGDKIENELVFKKNLIIPLSEGEWEVVNKYTIDVIGFPLKIIDLVKVNQNEVMEYFSIGEFRLKGREMGQIDNVVLSAMFKDRYDGCYMRPEYYLLEVYRRGGTYNCFRIRHIDVNKEIYNPDDPAHSQNGQIKLWIKQNSIKLPPIMLESFHSYFSRLAKGDWLLVEYAAIPKIYNSPKLNYFTEESSEFHRANIDRFPEHKTTMDRWISISAKRHKYLEKLFKAKNNHLLDLNKYIENNKIDEIGSKDIVTRLDELNKLFESGSITKEEFKKAKKILLD